MSEYWELSEYASDAYNDPNGEIEFKILANMASPRTVSNEYTYKLIEDENKLGNNVLLSIQAKVCDISYEHSWRNEFVVEDGSPIDTVGEFVLHNDLIEFIKLYFPYLYNTSILCFVKQWNRIDYLDYELEKELASVCHNLFFVLNNVQTKIVFENYLAKKYNSDKVSVEVVYRESHEEEIWNYGPDPDIREVGYQSVNRFFPAPGLQVSEKLFEEVFDSYRGLISGGCSGTDGLMRGYYLFASGGIKNVTVQCVDCTIQIEADVYQYLTKEETPIEDYARIKIDAFDMDVADPDEINGIEDRVFTEFWVCVGIGTAIYFAILSDEKLKKDFDNAKFVWIENAKKRKAEYLLEEQKKEEAERLEALQKEEAERQKRLAREREQLRVKNEQERIKAACWEVEKFLVDPVGIALYVKHNDYGAGIIAALTDSYGMKLLTVIFKGGTKKTFDYPRCFVSTLTMINEEEYLSAALPPTKKDSYWDY